MVRTLPTSPEWKWDTTASDDIYFEFYFSDNTLIRTNQISLPKTVQNIFNSYAVSGRGGSGSGQVTVSDNGTEV